MPSATTVPPAAAVVATAAPAPSCGAPVITPAATPGTKMARPNTAMAARIVEAACVSVMSAVGRTRVPKIELPMPTLGFNLVVQAAAFLWFIRPERKTTLRHLPAHPIHAFAAGLGLAPATALSYARARHAWSLRLARARAQQQAWRTAAFASFAVSLLLAASLASNVLGSSVAAHVIEGARAADTRDFADGRGRRLETLVTPDRRAELLPVTLPLPRSHGQAQEGEPW